MSAAFLRPSSISSILSVPPQTSSCTTEWEAMSLLQNIVTYSDVISDDELGELLGWYLQATYGNAHKCDQPLDEICLEIMSILSIRHVPEQVFRYWKDYVGTLQSTARTLFIAGVNHKFGDKQQMGMFSF
ncbi:hypothetical protein DV451_002953 [Geotrichum candidum]|uniref:Uncharacterized protein n=1 Tax=Geotrichum candidum TaxID=1173061 RepID=A0A9P5KTN5_GEOCN|nr:hypothetical protein DV451_002953 [Geotrichum candidum]